MEDKNKKNRHELGLQAHTTTMYFVRPANILIEKNLPSHLRKLKSGQE